MSITLTTPTAVSFNIDKVHVTDVRAVSNAAIVTVEVCSGATVCETHRLRIVNAPAKSSRIKKSGLAGAEAGAVLDTVSAAGAYTNLVAAYHSGGGNAAALRAVEQKGLDDGWIDASLTGTVA